MGDFCAAVRCGRADIYGGNGAREGNYWCTGAGGLGNHGPVRAMGLPNHARRETIVRLVYSSMPGCTAVVGSMTNVGHRDKNDKGRCYE